MDHQPGPSGALSPAQDLDRLNRTFTGALSALHEVGESSAGQTVRVTVSPRGAVLSVELSDGWLREAGESGLTGLVVETYSKACATQAQELLTGMADGPRAPVAEPSTVAIPAVAPRRFVGHEGDRDLRDIVTSGPGLAGQVTALIEEMTRVVTTPHRGVSSGDRVTVVLDGQGYLTDLSFDDDWIRRVAAHEINRHLREALAKARSSLPADPYAQALEQSGLGAILRSLSTI